ncbi:hypothetical protein PBY51_024755 [Eleginops maclovinus]|uniref:BZIP domain-containing protein n=1 Tax=Eleginops maclovinus TaxID=56733 RepID=A0AAN7Y0I5_ELEMC|nr:hypothetical protein PBY51_024755 [Eleginops maclovinus]
MSTPGSPAGPGMVSSRCMEPEPDPGHIFPVTRSSVLARRLLNLRAYSSSGIRRRREMIPNERKDSSYWVRRKKNNEAARRSREKKRLSDLMIEGQLLALSDENTQLRAQLLSMYHSSLGAEKRKPASATSNVPLSHAVFQPGLWGNNRSNAFSLDAKIPRFSATGVDGFNAQSSLFSQGTSPLSGTRVLSPEAEIDTQRQVSSSYDIHSSTDASSIRAFPPTPDHHASILSSGTWLLPHMNPPTVSNNFLLPWPSPYLTPPAFYRSMPLYSQERQGQGLGVEADIQPGGFKSRFSSAPAEVSAHGMHLSPD